MNLFPRSNSFEMAPFFNSFFPSKEDSNDNTFFSPRVDITEKDNRYEIVADLPGVKKEDISVQLQDSLLTIEAKTCEETKSEKDKVIRKERRTGFFSRSFSVGKNVNSDDINASFKDGVLTLNFDKMEDQVDEKRKITIN